MTNDNHFDRVRSQFTKQSEAYANTEQAKDERAMRWLVSLLDIKPDYLGFDLACGPGVLTCALAETCKSVVGLDATESLLDMARQRAKQGRLDNVTFLAGDVNELDYDEVFDVITCRAAFHHFERPNDVAQRLRRALKPDGVLMIADTIADEDEERARAHNAIERLCDPTHVAALSQSQFETVFKECDLNVRRCIRSELSYDLEGWIDHGGPSSEVAERIRKMMAEELEKDTTGLKVRLENEALYFSHQTAVFLLEH